MGHVVRRGRSGDRRHSPARARISPTAEIITNRTMVIISVPLCSVVFLNWRRRLCA
jgi:hypothetical protein